MILTFAKLKRISGLERSAAVLPLDQLRGLPENAASFDEYVSAVYFLWDGPRLLYVGHSHSVQARLVSHQLARDGLISGKQIPFNRTTVITWPPAELRIITDSLRAEVTASERAYIGHYRPPYNVRVPRAKCS